MADGRRGRVPVCRAAAGAVALVLALGLVLASCARDEPALVVDGWRLSKDDFRAELDQIAANAGYVAARTRRDPGFVVHRPGTRDVAPELVAELLNERVTFELAAAELRRRGVAIIDADRARAVEAITRDLAAGADPVPAPGSTATPTTVAPTTATPSTSTPSTSTPSTSTPATSGPGQVTAIGATSGTGPAATGTAPPVPGAGLAVLDAFGSYRAVLVDGVAAVQVLQRELVAEQRSDDALRALYQQVRGELGTQACVAHILFASDGSDASYQDALGRAVSAQAELDAGADFATVAASRSDDAATGARGGALGCAPRGQFTGAFEETVWSQPVGAVAGPVRSQLGYHLLVVRERREMSFEELRDDLAAVVDAQADEILARWLERATRAAEVSVDPALGRWDRATGTVVAVGEPRALPLVPDTAAPAGTTR